MAITEAQTRAELIDAQLGASGWNVKDPTQVVEEFDILTSLPDGVAEPRAKYEGQPSASKNQIEEIPFIFPTVHLQNEFSAIAAKVEGLKSRCQQSLADLESLYGALSQHAFKGELDLSLVPLPVESITEDTKSSEGLNRETRERRESRTGMAV